MPEPGSPLPPRSAPRYEYRVRWQRAGLGPVSKIFQTEKGALEKIDRLVRLEETKDLDDAEGGYGSFANMPDLLATPTLERREVGEWAPTGHDIELVREDGFEPDPRGAPEDVNAGIF